MGRPITKLGLERWDEALRAEHERQVSLHKTKRASYTAPGEHPLANYAAAGEGAGIGTDRAMYLRVQDKKARLDSLFRQRSDDRDDGLAVNEELRDIANLLTLMLVRRMLEGPA